MLSCLVSKTEQNRQTKTKKGFVSTRKDGNAGKNDVWNEQTMVKAALVKLKFTSADIPVCFNHSSSPFIYAGSYVSLHLHFW